ncbi:MAG: sensor histidine kinase [Peptoanaerobacter stomatis]|uniref:sensor histidine kinase n=1 Tax=Clostridia TaxID=186801 RepID=UPI003FA0DA77
MWISELFFLIVDLSIFHMVCNYFFYKRKMDKKIKFVVMILLLLLISIGVMFCISNLLLKYVILTIVICLMMNIFYKDKILSICLAAISIYGLFFMTDYVLVTVIEMDTKLQDFMISPKNVFIAYSLSRLISVLIIAIFSLKKSKIILENRYIYKFILISFLTIAGLITYIIPSEYNIIPSKYLVPFTLIFNNFFIYYILSDFIKISNRLRAKSINEERAKNELKLWQKLEEKDTLQRKIMHDYSNTLICIKGLLEQGNYEGTKQYLESISLEYELAKNFVATGNHLLDVLINAKYEKCLKNNITMILKLDNLTNIKIKSQDLIVLISNLLDNAIEYNMKLIENKREIFFSIHNNNQLELMVRNPLEESMEIRDNVIETTKKEDGHGLGLLNVKEVIEKYKAEHYIDVDEGYFTHYIEI